MHIPFPLLSFPPGASALSEKHPGFIVNAGNASVKDMADVIEECKRRVKDEYDVELHLEWQVI